MFYRAPLDWLNFFLADVRGGLGAYVGVFLLTQAHWNQATIGAVLTVSGLIGITLHAPIGALIDATHHKRGLIIAGTCALAASALAIAWAPTFPVVLSADILMAVAGAIFAPTVAAITLGMTPQQALPSRLGRNAAFDRAGNIFIAVLAGFVGWAFSQRAIFYLVPFFAVLTTLAVLSIAHASTTTAHEVSHTAGRLTTSSLRDGASFSNVAHCWSSRQQMHCSISLMHPCCPCLARN
jgi:MFS family permease